MRSGKLTYFIIGIFVGTALGVVAGLMFAPQSGGETRRRLAREAGRLQEAAKTVAERAESAVENVGTRMDHYLGRDEEVAWRKVQEIRDGVQRYSRTVMSS
ncbi:MAG: YtxH domain-containing protein [Coriobacteriia bacterium]|jgi:gas vesicle protein